MAEPEQKSWIREHAMILAVGAFLVVGIVVGVVGVTMALGADDELADAEAELASAEDDLADLEAQADSASDRLAEANSVAATTLTAAEQIAAEGRELCDCDQQLSVLADQLVQAGLAGNDEQWNTLLPEIDSWIAKYNAALAQIRIDALDVQPIDD